MIKVILSVWAILILVLLHFINSKEISAQPAHPLRMLLGQQGVGNKKQQVGMYWCSVLDIVPQLWAQLILCILLVTPSCSFSAGFHHGYATLHPLLHLLWVSSPAVVCLCFF